MGSYFRRIGLQKKEDPGMNTVPDAGAVNTEGEISSIPHEHREPEKISFEMILEDTLNAAGGTVILQSKILKPGWIYTVTNMCAWVDGVALTQAALGYESGGRFWIMRKRSTDDPFETVDLHGEIVLKEGDRIQATFYNTTAGDKLYVFVNGYQRRIQPL